LLLLLTLAGHAAATDAGGGKRSECVEVITPEQVLEAVRSLLEETA
jgi:hypothetical protein